MCGCAHLAPRDVACCPILGPKLQTLAHGTVAAWRPASGGKAWVAPGRSRLLLEPGWSHLRLCFGMGSGSRGLGWALWMVGGGNLIISTNSVPIQAKGYPASTQTLRERRMAGRGSLVGAHGSSEVSRPPRTLCPWLQLLFFLPSSQMVRSGPACPRSPSCEYKQMAGNRPCAQPVFPAEGRAARGVCAPAENAGTPAFHSGEIFFFLPVNFSQ